MNRNEREERINYFKLLSLCETKYMRKKLIKIFCFRHSIEKVFE